MWSHACCDKPNLSVKLDRLPKRPGSLQQANPAPYSLLLRPKNSRGVPNAVGAAFHVVAEDAIGRSNGVPVTVGKPPAADALDGGLDQTLARPTFSAHLAGRTTVGKPCNNPRKSRFPKMVPLPAYLGLILRLALGFFQQDRAGLAIRAGRPFGMGSHGENQRPLGERSRRKL
jgi:hypothetical protein